MATTLNNTHMEEEGVARTISKRDEAKAFARIVPLNLGLDGRARGALEL